MRKASVSDYHIDNRLFSRSFLDVLEFMALGFMVKDRDLYDVTCMTCMIL